MGYSCASAAGDVYDAIGRGCAEQTRSGNSYEFRGNRYFLERGREQRDGSITGTVYKCLPNDMAIKAGTFKIGADGTILRAHSILKEFARKHMRKLQARVYLY